MSIPAQRTILLFLMVIVTWLVPADVVSQASDKKVGYKFQFPYFEGTSRRPSSLVLGEKATRRSDGRVLIEGLKIVSFEYDEQNVAITNLLIEAPDCVLNVQDRIASSTNKLTARVPDGSFSIEGFGFEFRQVDSQLQISNQVTTVLKRPNLNLKPVRNEK